MLRRMGRIKKISYKGRMNLITDVDTRCEQLIISSIKKSFPDHSIISEESGKGGREKSDFCWLIDPLDGTKEFVNRNDEFTVNIALIDGGRPVFGVVHVPVSGVTYLGCEGYGAEKRDGKTEKIHVAVESDSPVRVVGSRSHRGASLDAFLENLGEFKMHPMGSSLKFCRVAEGAADIYPRLGLTSEWDTAAAQAVVEQAGGQVLKLDGSPLGYNSKADILNPFFLVIGPQDHDWLGLVADPD